MAAWPVGVSLESDGGDKLEFKNSKLTHEVKTGEEQQFTLSFVAPKEVCGRQCAFFRLSDGTNFFGPKVWIDILVV